MTQPSACTVHIILAAIHPLVRGEASVIVKPIVIAAALDPSCLHNASSGSNIADGLEIVLLVAFLEPAGLHVSVLVKIVHPVVDLFPLILNKSGRGLVAPSFSIFDPISGLEGHVVLPDPAGVDIILILIDPLVFGHLAVGLYITLSDPAVCLKSAVRIQIVALALECHPSCQFGTIFVQIPLAAFVKPAVSADCFLICRVLVAKCVRFCAGSHLKVHRVGRFGPNRCPDCIGSPFEGCLIGFDQRCDLIFQIIVSHIDRDCLGVGLSVIDQVGRNSVRRGAFYSVPVQNRDVFPQKIPALRKRHRYRIYANIADCLPASDGDRQDCRSFL